MLIPINVMINGVDRKIWVESNDVLQVRGGENDTWCQVSFKGACQEIVHVVLMPAGIAVQYFNKNRHDYHMDIISLDDLMDQIHSNISRQNESPRWYRETINKSQ